ncbi:hypothetical protein J2Z18_002412 [Paenibacillus lactis]|uniref:Uncharacterized protein n=2 Tax=Paenibacillus lactis TaxID=228574 RepID=G4H9X4_9BACL|nr:hypothetical protein PaelaDRAFT_0785 [Paenibacillus lactis 154]MBP1893310.1 hypothetical protein [Paenibacillus lactis]
MPLSCLFEFGKNRHAIAMALRKAPENTGCFTLWSFEVSIRPFNFLL